MTTQDRITAAVTTELGRRGMSRRELCEQLGKSPAWFSHKVAGRARWLSDDMDDVAAALGIPVLWLLTGEYRTSPRRDTAQYHGLVPLFSRGRRRWAAGVGTGAYAAA